MSTTKSLAEKLLDYSPEPNSGCWLWTGKLDYLGYGAVAHRKNGENRTKLLKAHRESFRYSCIDPGTDDVLHTCDVRCCINPDHLYLGNQLDNMRDMVKRGRHVKVFTKGELHGMHKLTADEVRFIRDNYGVNFRQIDLAEMFNVSQTCISKIIRGQRWKD